MKKSTFLFIAAMALCLSSCYCDKITVGHISQDEPLVHVASMHNAHFIYGAVVTHDKADKYILNTPNYVIENKQTFGDLFVSGITFGIYTPTTTKYYVPKSTSNIVVSKKKKWSKAYKGYLKD